MQMSRRRSPIRKAARRALSLLLVLAMAFGALPFLETPAAKAASWTQPYLDQMVEWGVMRGDESGNLNPDRNMTRAEFVAMINRALGYTETGAMPFTDVSPRDWYYDDINIAFNAGYFKGTSATTASPNSPLTREQAVVILGRTMMYRTRPGEVLEFTDSHSFQDWSKGYIREACLMNVIGGYPDGSFRPGKNITRGEVAAVLQRAVGTLIRDQGEVELGDVYGAVTIRTSGVTLKNTVIAGDLFITGGVGLGSVVLENVTVLGRIIVSGGGESHEGGNSVVLRNVMAGEMVVDNMANQFVTLRAEGDTIIGLTNVRAPAYLEDVTQDGYGLQRIELDGESGTNVTLAGNIKEVVNFSPSSLLTFAQGVARKVTIDEKATGSSVLIEEGATVKEMNLDVGTIVTGGGDIGSLNVNAPGCSTEMLPDTITIRPGITADIAGETMNSAQAVESSQDPRLLAGYPVAKNVAPTSADGVYSTNKQATVYWAITALADGSVNEDDLVNPPATGKIIRSGNTAAAASNTEYSNRFTGLISDGSYYISAVAVDNRGQRSPVKVAAFTTPDNTVPNFAAGYPSMLQIRKDSGQVQLMPTKSCQLYYAIFPKGSTAPTVMDFKTGSLEGNLGNGVRDVTKNVLEFVTFGNLQEVTSYDVYLCLIDADQNLNSAVRRLNFTTIDGTPPVFTQDPPVTNDIQRNYVNMETQVNENGTVFWVAVKQGTTYPVRMAGQEEAPALTDLSAKMQVESGSGNVISKGRFTVRGNQPASMRITGLQPQTGYDVYYVAKDTAGNYSEAVKKITIHTLDTEPPTFRQEFTRTADEEGLQPMADTDIKIIFNEGIQDSESHKIFYDLYQTAHNATLSEGERNQASKELEALLYKNITLMDYSANSRRDEVPQATAETGKNLAHWVDYSQVEIKMEDGQVIITFPYNKAAKLSSGGTYYFRLTNIADTSNNANQVRPNPTNMPDFVVQFAQVSLQRGSIADGPQKDGKDVRMDMSFQMRPASTQNVADSIAYDVYLWSHNIIKYEVYGRIKNAQTNAVVTDGSVKDPLTKDQTGLKDAGNGWVKLLEETTTPDVINGQRLGKSMRRGILGNPTNPTFPKLNELNEAYVYEYVISVLEIEQNNDPTTWSQTVTLDVSLPAGDSGRLRSLSANITDSAWNEAISQSLTNGGVRPVGNPLNFSVSQQFSDTAAPKFTSGYPNFRPHDTFAEIDLQLERPGTVYYVLAPMGPKECNENDSLTGPGGQMSISLPTTYASDAGKSGTVFPTDVPENGSDKKNMPKLATPTSLQIYQPNFGTTRIKSGNRAVATGTSTVTVTGLEASTLYYAYLVTRGASDVRSDVYLYKFVTSDVDTPEITLREASPQVNNSTSTQAVLQWALVPYNNLPKCLMEEFTGNYVKGNQTVIDNALGGSNKKVIDALLTEMPGSRRSVFDEYASDYAYSRVLAYVTGSESFGGSDPAGRGTLNTTANTNVSVDCDRYMESVAQYYYVAVARHTQGTTYGFKAVANVHKPDRTPPQFVSAITSTNAMAEDMNGKNVSLGDSERMKNPRNYYYSGTIALNFTERICVLIMDANGNRELITFSSDGTASNNKKLKDYIATAGGVEITVTSYGDVITLSYKKAYHGNTIMIFNDGVISDSSSNPAAQGARLTLRFDAGSANIIGYLPDANKTPIYGDPTPPEWKATWG